MMWAVLLVLGLIAVPFTIEMMRSQVTEKDRKSAPGQFALLSQGTTHYQWYGPDSGPVAVCIHGQTTPSFVWRGMAKGLVSMGFRVLTYDHYGRGFSDRPKGKQDAAFFLRQLDDLLRHEKVDGPITVLGYSMGGAVATHFAAAHPGAVKQLILLAPAGIRIHLGKAARFARDTPLIGDWLFMLGYPHMLRKGIAAEAGLKTSVENITDLQQAETDKRGFFPAVLSSFRGVLRAPAEGPHRQIAAEAVPVLAVWGQKDDLIPLSARDQLAQWNPNAVQAVIETAGHGLPYTHTDEVLKAIRATRG